MKPDNPFGVLNPEQLDPSYIAKYFVDIYTDIHSIREENNTFISGARGTGKSMLLRSLEPKVMIASGKAKALSGLKFLAIHVPLKKAEFGLPELRRLQGYAAVAIGEHLLAQQVMYRLFEFLVSVEATLEATTISAIADSYTRYTEISGGTTPQPLAGQSLSLRLIRDEVEREILRVRQYYNRTVFSTEIPAYTGQLTGFLDYVVPICRSIVAQSDFANPKIFLMLDDADNLPISLQKVLNTWVSTRSTETVCLKISTQLGYGTFRTLDDRIIESPHDFSEVNISTLYTNDNERYFKKIEQIAQRRLDLAEIKVGIREFFPEDAQQANRLSEIRRNIELEFSRMGGDKFGGAGRVSDAVTRFAVPTLMKELTGGSRSSHTFSYAGFESMVNLSSGVVRWFLDPVSRMFDEMMSATQSQAVDRVSVAIQDRVIREWSEEFISKLSSFRSDDDTARSADDEDASLHAQGHETHHYDQLRNLMDSLGLWFRHRLLDETAGERRAFSFVLGGEPSPQLRSVLGLGVRLGYFQLTSSAPKEKIGRRRPRYVLSRRLGPYYKLDISGYAAHLSVTARDLELALHDPKKFIASREPKSGESSQMSIDFEE
jgi:hypothetical protein